MSAMGICAFFYMGNLFNVVVLHRAMVSLRRGRSEFMWCSGIPQIYDQWEEGALVYVHSAICETHLV